VQSVVVDDQDNFWLLDPAAPKLQETVKDGPKLVKVDLATNKVTADDSVWRRCCAGEKLSQRRSRRHR
jgi:hypothetical protein